MSNMQQMRRFINKGLSYSQTFFSHLNTYIFNFAIAIITLPINMVRGISGFLVGLDIFLLCCLDRIPAPRNRIGNTILRLLVATFTTLISCILIPAYIIFAMTFIPGMVLTKIITSLTVGFLSWIASTIKNTWQSMRTNPAQTFKTIIVTALKSLIFAPITIILALIIMLPIAIVSRILYINFILSTNNNVSILSLPKIIAKSIYSIINNISIIIDQINKYPDTINKFYNGEENNREISFDEYLEAIENNNFVFFIFNLSLRTGEINLANKNLNDQDTSLLMAALQSNPLAACLISSINLSSNNINNATIPDTLSILKKLDLSDNSLENIILPNTFNHIIDINLKNNRLEIINIPNSILNTLTTLNVENNPLTDVMRYAISKLPNQFPLLNVIGIQEPQNAELNQAMLQQQLQKTLTLSLRPPLHLNAVDNSNRTRTMLLALWDRKQRKKNHIPVKLVHKIMQYAGLEYPVTEAMSLKIIHENMNTIQRYLQPANAEVTEESAMAEKFINAEEPQLFNKIQKLRNDASLKVVTKDFEGMQNRM
jgi:hypothetical protein